MDERAIRDLFKEHLAITEGRLAALEISLQAILLTLPEEIHSAARGLAERMIDSACQAAEDALSEVEDRN